MIKKEDLEQMSAQEFGESKFQLVDHLKGLTAEALSDSLADIPAEL